MFALVRLLLGTTKNCLEKPPDFVAKFKESKYIFMNKRTASSLGDEGVDEPEMSNKRKEARSKMNVLDKERLVWVDCEMTGLDIDTCHLIEVACLITDVQLNIIAEGPNIVIHQSDDVMDTMNEWCVKHHGESGLTEQVKDSKVSLRQAEMELLSFIRQHTPPSTCPLAGNSVHADKKFLDKYMPEFMKHLHYRIVDVSTIKELCRRWFPKDYENAPNKKMSHRALDDIKESIAELQYYRKTIFKT